jgi:peptidoglycan hydrolase-like protein with peptidoglycan-binding domain
MSFSLTWLPDVLKAADLKVALVDGWKTRGAGDIGHVEGVICHHTGGPRQGNMPSLATIRDGRPDLGGPLSQLGLGRDGTFYIVAAGRANHAGKGTWMGFATGNSSFIGIEAENTGRLNDFPWPNVQIDAYQRGVAAILKHLRKTAQCCAGHREYATPAGRKPDPTFDMDAFRAAVTAFIDGTAPPSELIPAIEPRPEGRPTLRWSNKQALTEKEKNLTKGIQKTLGVDQTGEFGPLTEAAVRRFQRRSGLVADGIVGPKTWLALDAATVR